MNENVFAGGPP